MKIKLSTKDLISKINSDLILTEKQRLDIEAYLNNKKNPNIVNTDYIDTIKKTTYFVFQDDREISFEILDGKLELNSNIENLWGALYANEDDILININADKQDINKILTDIPFEIISEENTIKKENFLNWENLISKVLSKKVEDNKSWEESEEELFEKEDRKIMTTIFNTYGIRKEHYLFKPRNVDSLIKMMMHSNESFNKVENFLILLKNRIYYTKRLENYESLDDMSLLDRSSIISFIKIELANKRVSNLFLDKYIKFVNNSDNEILKKELNNIVENIDDFFNTDEFDLAAKEFKLKINKILSSKETLLSDEVSGKFIYFNMNSGLSDNLKNDIDIFKKILPHLKEVDLINENRFPIFNNLTVSELADLWITDNSFLAKNPLFLKRVNSKKRFMEFVTVLKEKTKYPVDDTVSLLYFYIYRRLKKDKEISLFLMNEGYKFNYLENLDISDFDENFVNEVFKRNLYSFLPEEVLKKERDIDRVIKILNVSEGGFLHDVPSEWLTRDVLFAINNKSFRELNLFNKKINLEEITNNSIDSYMKLLNKDVGMYRVFPDNVKENQDVFLELIMINDNFAVDNIPNKLLFNKDFVIRCLTECDNVSKLCEKIPPVLWSVDDFLVKYLELIGEKDTSKENSLFFNLPTNIIDIFSKLEIKENYVNFIQMCYLENKLENRKPSKSLKL